MALGVTLGAVCLGLLVARKSMPGLGKAAAQGPIQILSQAPLGNRGIVYVLRCGPRVLVVGATNNQLTTLAEITDPDEIDQFGQLDRARPSRSHRRHIESGVTAAGGGELKGQLHGMLDKIESWNAQS
jgi:flagellar biogenesis protein FliO